MSVSLTVISFFGPGGNLFYTTALTYRRAWCGSWTWAIMASLLFFFYLKLAHLVVLVRLVQDTYFALDSPHLGRMSGAGTVLPPTINFRAVCTAQVFLGFRCQCRAASGEMCFRRRLYVKTSRLLRAAGCVQGTVCAGRRWGGHTRVCQMLGL